MRPYVFGIRGVRDAYTMGMKHEVDRTKVHTIRFFVRTWEYKHWTLFKTDLHLMGLDASAGDPPPLYPLGTDRLGRDMLSRIAFGTRVSMSIGLVGVAISVFLGILFGGISGYRGGLTDNVHPAPHRGAHIDPDAAAVDRPVRRPPAGLEHP